MKVLIAAGGSGGHIFPAIALAQSLKQMDPTSDIMLVGSNKVLDRRVFEREGFKYALLSANKLPYKLSPSLAPFFVRFFFDLLKSIAVVVLYRPQVCVGFGGYVSAPVIFAAAILGIPRVVHEQNVVPGRANRLLFKMADRIALSFKETMPLLGKDAKKAFFTGNPIRAAMLKSDKEAVMRRLGLDAKKFTILVIGGSQGAHRLNETFIKALMRLDEEKRGRLQVIHITGIKDYEWSIGEYKDLGIEHRIYSFIDRIEEAYAASDLVVTRSGASAIFEIASFGKPMILVPYPFAMSHQAENAKVFSRKGAAIDIEEKDLSADLFKKEMAGLLDDRARLCHMARSSEGLKVPEAADNLARQVLSIR